MSIINRIKKAIPTSSNPEPESNITAADFETTREENSDDTDSNSDSNPENSGNEEEQENEQSGEGGEQNDDGEEPDEEGDGGQSSLTDYEDPEDWETDNNDSGSSSGSDSDSDNDEQDDGSSGESDSDENDDEGDSEPGEGDGSSENDNGETSDTGEDSDGNEDGDGESDEGIPDETEPPGEDGDEPIEPDSESLENEQENLNQERQDIEQRLNNIENELDRFENSQSSDDGSNDSGNRNVKNIQFNSNPDGFTSARRWGQAIENKSRTANLLEERLLKSRRDSWKRGQNKGRLDPKRLHALRSKRMDVMRKRDPGSKKKYAVIFVLDRSGSMSTNDIRTAELAVAQYALALEALDIDVCIIDFYNDIARIISPFDVPIEESKGDLMDGGTSGTTPLSDVIHIARKRMEQSHKQPILISVTDGAPNNPGEYMEELNKCRMPILGITINMGGRRNPSTIAEQEEYYDIHGYVTTQDELEEELEKMTMEIDF